jgi:hypothetical protein
VSAEALAAPSLQDGRPAAPAAGRLRNKPSLVQMAAEEMRRMILSGE